MASVIVAASLFRVPVSREGGLTTEVFTLMSLWPKPRLVSFVGKVPQQSSVSSFLNPVKSTSGEGSSERKLSFLFMCSIDFAARKSESRDVGNEIRLVDESISDLLLATDSTNDRRLITSIERRLIVFLSMFFPDGVFTRFSTSYDLAPLSARYELYCLMSAGFGLFRCCCSSSAPVFFFRWSSEACSL